MYELKKSRPNPILWSIIAGIALLHVIALLIFGGLTVYRFINPTDMAFEAPPPAESIDRLQLEFRARLEQKQRQSTRMQQRLQVQTVANMQMPDLNIQVPNLSGLSSFGGAGNLGGLEGGLGMADISINLFDLQSRGERFLFVIDANRELMIDRRGGLPSFRVIKEEIIRLVNEMPGGVLFNAIVFEGRSVHAWRPNLFAATEDNKTQFENWLNPINQSVQRLGAPPQNFFPQSWRMDTGNRLRTSSSFANNHFLVTAAMLEQGADAIYFLSNNFPAFDQARITVAKSEQEFAREMRDFEAKLRRAGFQTVVDYHRARSQYNAQIARLIAEYKQREAQDRQRRGLPPRVYGAAEERQLRERIERENAREIRPVPGIRQPRRSTTENVESREILGWFDQIARIHYDQHNRRRPTINAIMYRGADEEWTRDDDRRLTDFVRRFNGRHRVLKGLGAIR